MDGDLRGGGEASWHSWVLRVCNKGVGWRGVLVGCADSLLALLVHLRSGAVQAAETYSPPSPSDHHDHVNPTVCLSEEPLRNLFCRHVPG
jgi:hypothetical protein